MHKNLDLSFNLLKTNHFQSNPSHSNSNSKSKVHSSRSNLLNSIIKPHHNHKSNPISETSHHHLSIKHGEDLNNFIWDDIPPTTRTDSNHPTSTDDDYEKRSKEMVKIYHPGLKPSLQSQHSTLTLDPHPIQEAQSPSESMKIAPRSAPLPILNQPILSSIPKHLILKSTSASQSNHHHPMNSSSSSSSSDDDHLNLSSSSNRPRSYSTPIEPIHNLDFNSNSTLQHITESDHFNSQISSNHHHQIINKLPIPPSSSSKLKSSSDYSSTPITPNLIRTAGSSTSSSNTTTSTEFKVLPRIGPKPNQINLVSEIRLENQEEADQTEGQEAKNQAYPEMILERLPVRTSSIPKTDHPSLSHHQSGRVKVPKDDYVIFHPSNLNHTGI